MSIDEKWDVIQGLRARRDVLRRERYVDFPIPSVERIKEIRKEIEQLRLEIRAVEAEINLGNKGYLLANGKVLMIMDSEYTELEVVNYPPQSNLHLLE